MTCKCITCRAKAKTLPGWDGFASTDLFLTGKDGQPVHAATMQIQAVPMLVEPLELHKILAEASKSLSKVMANFTKDKTLN